jgi:hypothetical protein
MVTNVDRVKPPRFNGSLAWTIFHCQFEAMVGHNWALWEKATYLLSILHSVLAEAMWEEINQGI